MGFFSDLFHPGRAYKLAGEKEEQGYKEGQGYREPYLEGGKSGGKSLQEMIDRLKDPAALENEWSQSYQTSPYAQQLLQENLGEGLDTASAMGLSGSSSALSNIQRGAGDIQSKDRQQYMKDLMDKYLAGIGIGTTQYTTGANTAGQAGEASQRHGEWSGQNTYNKNAAGVNMAGGIAGGLANLIANIMGQKGMYGGNNTGSGYGGGQ